MGASLRDGATGEVLVPSLELALTSWTRFRGLMFRSSMPGGRGLLIKPCMSIHMLFMRFPIDAVFMDGQGQVTRIARGVRPWFGFAWGGRRARAVIELPAGGATGFREGQTLEIIEVQL